MEEEKKIYIGNLPFGVSDETLKKSMEEKGLSAKDVKVITDKFSGKSKGFAFAEFDTPEQAQAAIDALNGMELDGRPLRVSKAQKMRPRQDRIGGDRGDRGDRGGRGGFGGSRGGPRF